MDLSPVLTDPEMGFTAFTVLDRTSDFYGFALWADSYDDQSEADRAAHRAVPIQAALTLAGSLESVVITVNVRA